MAQLGSYLSKRQFKAEMQLLKFTIIDSLQLPLKRFSRQSMVVTSTW
jgi:hypothetical protein